MRFKNILYNLYRLICSFRFILLALVCNPQCINGGTCVKYINNQTMCNCPPGYDGDQCEKGKHVSYYSVQTNVVQRAIKG